MSRIKLSSRVAIPQSVKDAQLGYKKAVHGGTKADAAAAYANAIKKGMMPENARVVQRQARRGILGRTYIGQIDERYRSLRDDFKINKLFGLVFTVLGTRLISDYKSVRRGLRKNLDAIGYALSAEIARDPALRKTIGDISKKYRYMYVNKNGEIFLTSYTGSIFDKDKVSGKLFNPESLIPSKAEIRASKKVFWQKVDLKALVSMGSPRFESAQISSRKGRAALSPAEKVTAAALGDNEIHVFSRSTVGGTVKAKEEVINSENIKSKRLANSSVAGKKILWLKTKKGELIKLELDEKTAKVIYKAFKLKE